MSVEQLTIAPGTRLLHIGPHKTGTTALQGAFHHARDRLAEQGVVYAGRGRQPAHAAGAIAGGGPVNSREQPRPEHWERLCAEVANAGNQTVVISSERFSNGDDEAARRVVEGLGGPRVHVVVTLRPLLKIIPSQWQQYVQNGARYSYEHWLEGMFRRPPYTKPTPSFWRRHRHDVLVERWANAVGRDNLTVVVVDDNEPLKPLRVFEELIGLPTGFLIPEEGVVNRSLTLGEVELLRQLNKELRKRNWPDNLYGRVVRGGVMRRMRDTHRPSPDEPRIVTPRWAAEAAAQVSEEMTAKIAVSGVRVVGDLAVLTPTPKLTTEPADPPQLPSTAAAEAVLGAILASQPTTDVPKTPHPGALDDRPVRSVPATELLRILRQRGLRRLRGSRTVA